MSNEAFARVKIDQVPRDADWTLTDGRSVRFEYPLDDGGKADYVLFDRQGRALAVLEAESTSVDLMAGEAQGQRYADLLGWHLWGTGVGDVAQSAETICMVDGDSHRQRGYRVNAGDMLPRRWSVGARLLRTVLWFASVAILFSKTASAETLVHVSRPVWGCVDPNEATRINCKSFNLI